MSANSPKNTQESMAVSRDQHDCDGAGYRQLCTSGCLQARQTEHEHQRAQQGDQVWRIARVRGVVRKEYAGVDAAAEPDESGQNQGPASSSGDAVPDVIDPPWDRIHEATICG
jgi:hypothetical protein